MFSWYRERRCLSYLSSSVIINIHSYSPIIEKLTQQWGCVKTSTAEEDPFLPLNDQLQYVEDKFWHYVGWFAVGKRIRSADEWLWIRGSGEGGGKQVREREGKGKGFGSVTQVGGSRGGGRRKFPKRQSISVWGCAWEDWHQSLFCSAQEGMS